MKEQELETMCCNLAEAVGWLSFKGFTRNGGADRIFFRDGRCFLVEFKTMTGKVRQNQKVEAEAMKKNRTPYFVVRTLEEFKDILISRGKNNEWWGDDSESSFHKRLKEDLEALK